jgi:aryl-alcohol dehydrogenase-like predicted oxidoreductase
MQKRAFGQTGIWVTVLGFGAMHLNDERTSEVEAGRLLNEVLDAGINLIDTARGYGLSEDRIGRHIAHRRSEYVLSTKVGYAIPGFADWTYDCIVAGVEAACQRMNTDVIDIVHLHSCPLNILECGDVVRALEDCQISGKLRVAAYSGDNTELRWAIESGRFGSVQTSVSVFDQSNLTQHLPLAQSRNLGVIAKRPLAGGIWRFSDRPGDEAEGMYWDRFHTMDIDIKGLEWDELALRFSAFAPGVGSAIVGTNRLENLQRNLDIVNRGPLEEATQALITQTFAACNDGWKSII